MSAKIFPFDFSNNYPMNLLLDGTRRHEKQDFELEEFALEPCNNASHQRLHDPTHQIDRLLIPNAKCVRKRKLNPYGFEVATDLGLISREKCGNQNAIINEKVEHFSICRQYYLDLGDSDALTEVSNSMKQRHLKNHRKNLVTSNNYVTSAEASMEKSTMQLSKALDSLVYGDFDNPIEISDSSDSENEDIELNQPQKDNHIPRPVIPIGPRFQAEVPKWEGITNVRHHNSYDDLKWLGLQLWPMPNIKEKKTKQDIGKGRIDSCSCKLPGSVDCVQLHIREARELLKLEIGTTFLSWKFDEMGEDVSKSWTLEEQEKFDSLVANMLKNGTNIWKLAKKHFPSKPMNCMINYYHNVYIPRRLRMEARSFDDVLSDNDQYEKFNKNGNGGHFGQRWLWRQSQSVVVGHFHGSDRLL